MLEFKSMKRRTFIQITGLAIGSIAVGQFIISNSRNKTYKTLFNASFLTAKMQNDLLAISRFVLPKDTKTETVIECLKKIDVYANEIGPLQREQLSQAIGLIDASSPIKLLTSGVMDLSKAEDVNATLDVWKNSFDHLILGNKLRQAYKGIIDVLYLGFYSQPEGHKKARYQR